MHIWDIVIFHICNMAKQEITMWMWKNSVCYYWTPEEKELKLENIEKRLEKKDIEGI